MTRLFYAVKNKITIFVKINPKLIMKKLGLVGLMALMSIFVGCKSNANDDMIWDFPCWSINFEPGIAGEMIFDPTYNGNILDKLTVEYKGTTYKAEPLSKVLPARFSGLFYQKDPVSGKNRLFFGEFSPSDDYHDERMIINWPDGSLSDVTFDLFVTWQKKDPTVNKKLRVDGVEDDKRVSWVVIN